MSDFEKRLQKQLLRGVVGQPVLSGQCLDRRIPNQTALEREVSAWLDRRNARHAKASWRFTTADARIKLKSLYPAF